MDLISAVEPMFRELADRLGPASAKLEIQRLRGLADEEWLAIELRPSSQESAPIHVDVLTDEIVFGVGDYGCRIDLEVGDRMSAQDALDELRQMAMAVLEGGYHEIVKEIPLAGKHVQGVLNLGEKTIHLSCGLPLGNVLSGRSTAIKYRPYDGRGPRS